MSRCRSRSVYGACALQQHEGTEHAVAIDVGYFYGYVTRPGRESTPLGYGHMTSDGSILYAQRNRQEATR